MAFDSNMAARRLRSNGSDVRGKRGMAFIVEALVLLLFLVLAVTVFVQLLGGAVVRSQQATDLENAVQIAQDAAETFAADPQSFQPEDQGVYAVDADIERTATSAGALYRATIKVGKDGEEGSIYELSTARYVESSRTRAQAAAGAQAATPDQPMEGQQAATPDQQPAGGEANG